MKKIIFAGALLAILATNCLNSSLALASPRRVLIIRHAEKPTDTNSDDLSPQGYARAQALIKLFQVHPEYAVPTLPTEIYAAQFVPHKHSKRSVETVTPLAQSLNLQVQDRFSEEEPEMLASELIQNPIHNQTLILIAWAHGAIPRLAAALGAACADNWSHDVFDRVWIIDFTGKDITCEDVPESVLPGDSK